MQTYLRVPLFALLVTLVFTPTAVADYPAVPVVQAPTATNQILAKTTEIQVNTNLDSVQKVEVKVNGKTVKAEVGSDGIILVGTLIGPKDKVQVTIQTDSGVSTDVKITRSTDPVSFANVNFAVNSSALTNQSRNLLNRVASIVKAKGFKSVSLVGYTDSDGSNPLNQALSLARAKAVESYLKSRGLSVKFSLRARADMDPIADNDTKQGKALNRRVEIVVS